MDAYDIVKKRLAELKTRGATTLSDDDMRLLDCCFADDGAFDRGLEAVDAGNVIRVEATVGAAGKLHTSSSLSAACDVTSATDDVKRVLYQVLSSAPRSKYAKGEETMHKRYDAEASGIDANGCYTVLPHYCTCADYNMRVLATGKRRWCKHLIAVAIADAIGKYTTRSVSETEFATIIMQLAPS